MDIKEIRAAGTPDPGRKQGKQPSKAQKEKQSKNEQILTKLSHIEHVLGQFNQALQQHEQQIRVGALERHVALTILEQQVGRETIESIMAKRAEHFGLQLSFDEDQKVDENDKDDTNESSKSDTNVSKSEQYEGSEEYSE